MSVHATSWAWKQKVGDSSAKLVLLKLADNANDQGYAWPYITTIAKECECGEKTVRRKIQLLRELGLINWERDNERPGRPNVYLIGRSVPVTAMTAPKREPSIEPERSIRPVKESCPECGVSPKGKTLAEHREDVHGVRAA